MPTIKLTDSYIKSISAHKKRVEISDSLKPGLVLRVSDTGKKVFVYRYRVNGKSKRYTIGDYPLISLSKARSIADDLYIKTKQEIDPQKEKLLVRNRKIVTITDLAESYKSRHFLTLKKSTSDDYKRRIENVILPALGSIEIEELTRHQIIDFLDEVSQSAPIQSNRVRAILSSMYSFGVKMGFVDFNVVSTVKPLNEEQTRDRVYSEKEVKSLWSAFDKEQDPVRTLFKVLLLTGQRLGETSRMKWSDIHDETWIIPAEETKAKRVHHVPLSPMVLGLINNLKKDSSSIFVFESPLKKGEPIKWLQKASIRVSKSSGVDDFRIHDLRRTAASIMASLGTPRTVIGKILNHKGLSGDSKVTAVYDRYNYLTEKRDSLYNYSIYLSNVKNQK